MNLQPSWNKKWDDWTIPTRRNDLHMKIGDILPRWVSWFDATARQETARRNPRPKIGVASRATNWWWNVMKHSMIRMLLLDTFRIFWVLKKSWSAKDIERNTSRKKKPETETVEYWLRIDFRCYFLVVTICDHEALWMNVYHSWNLGIEFACFIFSWLAGEWFENQGIYINSGIWESIDPKFMSIICHTSVSFNFLLFNFNSWHQNCHQMPRWQLLIFCNASVGMEVVAFTRHAKALLIVLRDGMKFQKTRFVETCIQIVLFTLPKKIEAMGHRFFLLRSWIPPKDALKYKVGNNRCVKSIERSMAESLYLAFWDSKFYQWFILWFVATFLVHKR